MEWQATIASSVRTFPPLLHHLQSCFRRSLFGRQIARVLLRISSQCCCAVQCLLLPILMHLSSCLWTPVTLEWAVFCYRRTPKVLITLCVIIQKIWTVTGIITLLVKKRLWLCCCLFSIRRS